MSVGILNAAILSICDLYTFVLIVAYISKRNKTMMSWPFIYFSSATAILIFCGIWECLCPPSSVFYRILFVLDYVLFYCISVAYFNYVRTYTYGLKHPNEKVMEKMGPKLKAGLVIYGLAISLLFASSIWSGWFYYFDAHGREVYTPFYSIVYVLCGGALLCALWIIIKNRKLYKKEQVIWLIIYAVAPGITAIAISLADFPIVYVILALVVYIIDLRVDHAMTERLLEEKAKVARKEYEMSEVKMELMMSQIQPHFLYNTLTSIAYLCTEDPEEAEKTTIEFSRYLRANLQSIGTKQPVSFQAELKHTEQYLNIEKRRFHDRLNIVYDIQETDFQIPALTLQTLVENAVRYSVTSKYEPSTVAIVTRKTEDEYIVRIMDDGPGFDVNTDPKDGRRHIGIEGSRFRLSEMMGGYLEIDSVIGKGTTVTIHIPA